MAASSHAVPETRGAEIVGVYFPRFKDRGLETKYVKNITTTSSRPLLAVLAGCLLMMVLVHGSSILDGTRGNSGIANWFLWLNSLFQVFTSLLGLMIWYQYVYKDREPFGISPDSASAVWSVLFNYTLFGCNTWRVGALLSGNAIEFLRSHGESNPSDSLLLLCLVGNNLVVNFMLGSRSSRTWATALSSIVFYLVLSVFFSMGPEGTKRTFQLAAVLSLCCFIAWRARLRAELAERELWANNASLQDEVFALSEELIEHRTRATGDPFSLQKALTTELEEAFWVKEEDAIDRLRLELQENHSWQHETWDEFKTETLKRQSEEAGVSVSYLLSEELELLVRERSNIADPTFHDLKDVFFLCQDPIGKDCICPRDGRQGCAMVDTLSPRFRRQSSHFLSWTWGYPLSLVQSALRTWAEERQVDNESVHLFMCFFVNNQHRILIECSSLGSSSLETTFKQNLGRCGKMIALMDSWHNPIYLSRIWTIYEQYVAYELDIPVDMILPASESEGMLNEIQLGTQGILRVRNSLSNIDSERAQAWDPKDESTVKLLIKTAVGFQSLNEELQHRMLSWVGYVLQTYIGSLLRDENPLRRSMSAHTILSRRSDQFLAHGFSMGLGPQATISRSQDHGFSADSRVAIRRSDSSDNSKATIGISI